MKETLFISEMQRMCAVFEVCKEETPRHKIISKSYVKMATNSLNKAINNLLDIGALKKVYYSANSVSYVSKDVQIFELINDRFKIVSTRKVKKEPKKDDPTKPVVENNITKTPILNNGRIIGYITEVKERHAQRRAYRPEWRGIGSSFNNTIYE